MEFLLGMITATALIGFGCFCYMLGHKKQPAQAITEDEKRKQDKLTELNEGYNKLLNYSIETAYKARRG